MKETTMRAIEVLRNMVGDNYFRAEDTKGIVSIQTLRRYDLIESELYIYSKTEYSLTEVVGLLNAWEGEDCYCDPNGYYSEWVVEDGRVYNIVRTHGYRFK